MAKAHDIVFKVNSGDSKGAEYGFTLAIVENQKAWTSTRLLLQPPDMRKEKIDLVLTARENNIPLSGGLELKLVGYILAQIEALSKETDPITLVGIDKITRLVLVGAQGAQLTPVIHENEREPEYQVKLTCWGLYEV